MSTLVFTVSCLPFSKIKGRDCGTISGHNESLSILALMKVDAADEQKLLCDVDTVLKEDIIASKSLLVMPKGSVILNMPMDEDSDTEKT